MRLTNASAKAIKYACLNFHYAKAVPVVQYGFNVYNDENEWCGVICYGSGANNHIAGPFKLAQGEVLELVRVALNGKQKTTSECLAASLKELRKQNPLCKIVVSYADCDQNHNGTIYQATNWIYLGKMNEKTRSAFIIKGRKTHPRSVAAMGGKQTLEWIRENLDKNAKPFFTDGKHKYIFCFDKKLRKHWVKQSLPYPKKNVA